MFSLLDILCTPVLITAEHTVSHSIFSHFITFRNKYFCFKTFQMSLETKTQKLGDLLLRLGNDP